MKLLRRLNYWIHQRQREAELAEEIEFHRAQSAGPIGNTTLAREDARAVWIWPWLESVIQDLRYAVRNMRRQPGFTAVVVLTLGIAIGLNTSFFSVFDAVMLRPWPVKDSRQVVQVLSQEKKSASPQGFSLAEYRFFVENARSLREIVAMGGRPVRLGFEGFGKRSWEIAVSGNYFQALGVAMQLGLGFIPEEDDLDSPKNVAVLSFPLWRDHFGSDPEISGKQIQLDEVAFTIVGVAGEEFTGTLGGSEDLWIPASALQSLRLQGDTHAFVRQPQACCWSLAGRIARGSSRDQVRAELSVLSTQFHAEHKLDPVAVRLADPTILAAHPKRNNFVPVFGLMLAALALVLLLACANVSNLLLAQAAARRREISVRRSLGAGRARVVRQLLTEGFVLAAVSAALGVALAWKLPDYVFAVVGEGPNVRLIPDSGVILYAALLAGVTCVAFALAPALHGTQPDSRHTRMRLRNTLLGIQFAICVVLLIGAGLLVSGIQHAREQNPGFRIHDVSVVSFEVPADAYDSRRALQFFNELSKDLSGPEFAPTAITVREPLSRSQSYSMFRLPGETPDQEHMANSQQVSPGYFDMLGIPLVAGQNFQSGEEDRNVVLINESFARLYLDGSNPVGKSIVQRTTTATIVGVVRDANLSSVEGPMPTLFTPIAGDQIPKVLVRTGTAAQALATIAKRIEPKARVQITSLSDNLDEQLSGSQTMAAIAGALGVFALALASIGVAGVFAYRIFSYYGYLWFTSAGPSHGKSRVEKLLSMLCFNASAPITVPSPATLFRDTQVNAGTLILDEVENVDPESKAEILAILNAGFEQGREVTRSTPAGDNWKAAHFQVYCPKVLAGISNLPRTLHTRVFQVEMPRRKPTEPIALLEPDRLQDDVCKLRDDQAIFAFRNAAAIAAAYARRDSFFPDGAIEDLLRDILAPLYAIASVIEGELGDINVSRELAQFAALQSKKRMDDSHSDIYTVLVHCLYEWAEQQWKDGKAVIQTVEASSLFNSAGLGLDLRQVKQYLAKLGGVNKPVWWGGRTIRGYVFEQIDLQDLSTLSASWSCIGMSCIRPLGALGGLSIKGLMCSSRHQICKYLTANKFASEVHSVRVLTLLTVQSSPLGELE
jgi:predicted permease